jgi:hypothetical protein
MQRLASDCERKLFEMQFGRLAQVGNHLLDGVSQDRGARLGVEGPSIRPTRRASAWQSAASRLPNSVPSGQEYGAWRAARQRVRVAIDAVAQPMEPCVRP